MPQLNEQYHYILPPEDEYKSHPGLHEPESAIEVERRDKLRSAYLGKLKSYDETGIRDIPENELLISDPNYPYYMCRESFVNPIIEIMQDVQDLEPWMLNPAYRREFFNRLNALMLLAKRKREPKDICYIEDSLKFLSKALSEKDSEDETRRQRTN